MCQHISFFSQTKIVQCGVPRGSTLRPLLFLIYMSDFNYAEDKCRVHHFADDTNVLFGNKYPSEISCVMNNDLKLLTDWLGANKLSLNESKTKLLIFRPSRKLNNAVPNIKLNTFILTPEKTVTYFGIEIDENLSRNKQIKLLAKTLSKTNGILPKLRSHVSKKTLTSIYYSLFQSYIVYGSTV